MNEQNTNKEIIDLDYAAEDQYEENEDFDELDDHEDTEDNSQQEQRKPGTFYPGDPRINRHGRPIVPKSRRKTSREKKVDDLQLLVRRLRPLLADGIKESHKILMGKNGATAGNQLQAAQFIAKTYIDLVNEIHSEQDKERKEQEEKRKAKLLERQKVLELDNNTNNGDNPAVVVDWRPVEE